jgi:hypothetical protein
MFGLVMQIDNMLTGMQRTISAEQTFEDFDDWFEKEGMEAADGIYVEGLQLGDVRDFARIVWRAAKGSK